MAYLAGEMTTSQYTPRLDEPRPIALANTIWTDRIGVHDALGAIEDVRGWIRAVGERMTLSPAPAGDEEVTTAAAQRLIELRDAVRRLAAEHTHDPRSLGQSDVPDQSTAVEIVNAACAAGFVRSELVVDRLKPTRRDVWIKGSFADAVTAVIASETIDLVTSEQWDRLRPCVAPGCAYYFVKEHFRQQWCSAVCGNRARVARHAQHRRIR